ncbi:MAG: hypothetical protein ACXQTV_02790 [Candidatus Hecatellaceae archaeon]
MLVSAGISALKGEGRVKPVRNYLIKSLLYFLVNKKTDLEHGFPVKEWCRGYVILTHDTLYLQPPSGNYGFAMPLSYVARIERFSRRENLKHLPKNFMAAKLEVEDNHKNDVYSVIFSGPRSVMAPFWGKLLQQVRRLRVQEEYKDLKRLLYLLSLGVKNLKSLSFLLNLEREKVLSYLLKLYRARLINRFGDLTDRGFQRLSELKLPSQMVSDLEELLEYHRNLSAWHGIKIEY